MKKIVLLSVGLLISCLSFAQTTIWSSDFSNASDWTITNNSAAGSLNWSITNSLPTSVSNPDLYKYWFTPLTITSFNSTSKGNFALLDGSKAGSGTRGAIIKTANSINLSGKPNVIIKFQQLYRRYKDSAIVEVSTDNIKWTKHFFNGKYAQDSYSTNPENVSIDISKTAGDQPKVWIRFRFVGNTLANDFDYAWFIDDFSVQTIPDVDASNWFSKFKTQSSKCGLVGDSIGVYIINNGITALTNTTQIGYKINSDVSVIENAVFLDIRTLLPKSNVLKGDTAIHYFSKKIDFSSPNTLYNIKVFVNSTNDSDRSNDTSSLSIKNYIPFDLTNSTPYSENFEAQVEPLGGFTSEKINNTGALFRISTYGNTQVTANGKYSIVVSAPAKGVSEDWAYSRCLNLSPDYTYTLSYYSALYLKSSTGPYAGKIESKLGTSNSSSSMTQSIGTLKTLTPDGKFYQTTNTFNVTSANTYYLGFKATNTSKDSSIVLFIDDVSITAKGNKADLLSFGVKTPNLTYGQINTNTVVITIPKGYSKIALITQFQVSPGATLKLNNTPFTNGSNTFDYSKGNVTCEVTSEDGKTTKTYTIQILESQSQLSSNKDFLTFSINGKLGVIGANTISVLLPAGTSLSNLTPTYTTSAKSSVTTGANTTNFTNPVTFIVTAEDGTTKTYTITVTLEQAVLSNLCDLTSFTLGLTQGSINNNQIIITLPSGSSLSQTASFVVSKGSTVKVNGVIQQSGLTSNTYSSDLIYEVTAEDGVTKKSYTVKVSVSTPPVLGCKDLDNWKDGANSKSALYATDSTGYSGNGYFTGTGTNYFQGIYEKFETLKNDSKTYKLNSVKYSFGALVAGNDTNTIQFIGYLPTSVTDLPGKVKLFSKRILVKTVKSNLTSTGDYVLDLSGDNLQVKGSFYAGIQFKYRKAWKTPNVGQDTIALYSNTAGAQGSTINSAYCMYKTSATDTTFDTIMPSAYKFSLGIYANVCELSSAKDLFSFNFVSPSGTLSTSGTTITVTLPVGTNTSVLSSLVATFTSSAKSTVKIGSVLQISGQTSNNFTNAQVYTVTAEDGSTKDYTVKVTIEQAPSSKSSSKDFLTFSINGQLGVIGANTISVVLPAGTSLSNLTPTYTTSAKSSVTTGANTTNFTNPVTFIVTAEDGTTKTYTVTVTIQQSQKSSAKDILTYSINGVNGVISGNAITLTLPVGTSLTNLTAVYTTSPKSSVTTGANTTNFTNPATYVVTAEDLTTKTYTVTVLVSQTNKSSAKDILTYSINGVNGVISGNAITLTLPIGTSLTNLTAVYTTSPNSSVTTGANTTNFTNPVTYVVTAEDLTTKTYTVTVTVSTSNQNTAADILTFGFTNPNVIGVISGTTITVSVPYGTNIKSLVSTFTVSAGASVKVSNIVQNSGGSVIDYTSPVTFAVTSQDGKTVKTYIVTVTITPLLSSAKEMITFGFASPSAVGTISGNTIGLTVPFGTNVSALVANFTSSPNSIVRVGSTIQVSGTTPNSFTSTLKYTVIAQDGSAKDYLVEVIVSSQSGGNGSSDKDILSFGLLNPYISGAISGTNITITGQQGSDITKQQIYFSVSPGAILTLNGVVLTTNVSIVNFTNPVNITVTATDGSKKDYVVTVIIPKKSDKEFTFFRFIESPTAIGKINDSLKTITVHVPYSFTNNLNFTAVFGVSPGAIVKIGNIQQSSGASQLPYNSSVVFTVVAEDGTTVMYTVIIIVDPQVLGVEEEENSVVRIYPNPSIGVFTCESSIESYDLNITDILGHTVYTSRIESNGTDSYTFDLTSFGSGVYFATLHYGTSSKLIKLEVIK